MIITKHSLESVKDKLLNELNSISFIQPYLQRLLQRPYYYRIQQDNISIEYISIRTLTQHKIKKILLRLIAVSNYFKITHPIRIWFIPCNIKRFFPKKKEPIDQEHINGAYTYTSNHTIFVYRLDEFPKVFIHELLHNSILDTTIPEEQELYPLFSIDQTNCNTYCKTQLRVNEAVIEAWALMTHLQFVASESKKSFDDLLKDELEWSLYLCKKLKEYQEQIYPVWKEFTHSYSYIRLKTCILFFKDAFLKIKYPYTGKQIVNFFKKYNFDPTFEKAIQNAKDFKSNSFNMTVYGNY